MKTKCQTVVPLSLTLFWKLVHLQGVEKIKVLGQKLQGLCVTGSVFESPAVSPAFVEENYDSTEYSTWAEST